MTLARGVRLTPLARLAERTGVLAHTAIGTLITRHNIGLEPLPPSCDLARWEPPRADQGPTQTCFAHSTAWATATAVAFRRAGGMVPDLPDFTPSPRLIAACVTALARGRLPYAPGVVPSGLDDEGGTIADVAQVLEDYGVVPMGPGVDGRNSDVGPESLTAEVDLGSLEAAGQRLVTGEYGVDPAASDASDKLAACLFAGVPVVVVLYADAALEQLAPGAVAGVPDMVSGGWHAVYLSGYQEVAGERCFWASNSWGIGWSSGGRGLLGPACMERVAELWPWAVAGAS